MDMTDVRVYMVGSIRWIKIKKYGCVKYLMV